MIQRQSLRKQILKRLKELPGWVHKGQIEARAKEWGYLGDYATRLCRKLAEEGLIEAKEFNGSMCYRYKPQEKEVTKIEVREGVAVITKQLTLV